MQLGWDSPNNRARKEENKSISDELFNKFTLCAINSGIDCSDSRFEFFINNLINQGIFIIDKNNVGILTKKNKFKDSVKSIVMNGQLTQINF